MKIQNEFELGQIVYLETDPEQYARLVTEIIVCVDGSLLYGLCCGSTYGKHYPSEISTEKKVI